MNKSRWKRIWQEDFSMCIKKVMWLRYGTAKPNLWTNLVPHHLKCYGHFEMSEQSLSSMYFCTMHLFCFVCSLWGTSNLLYRPMKIIIFRGFSYFSPFLQFLLLSYIVIYSLAPGSSTRKWLVGWKWCLFANVLCDISILCIH